MAYRSQDSWSSDYDYLIDLGHQIKSEIREKSGTQHVTSLLRDYEKTLNSMRRQINSRSLSEGERFQRQKDIDELTEKLDQINRSLMLNSTQPFDEDDHGLRSRGPGLGQRMTVEEMQQQQKQLIAEQDKGLEAISAALRRQQKVGLAIQDEVTEHNVIIDDISAGTSRADARIKRETQRIEQRRKKEKTWCTCILWTIIIVLAVAIIIVSVVPN